MLARFLPIPPRTRLREAAREGVRLAVVTLVLGVEGSPPAITVLAARTGRVRCALLGGRGSSGFSASDESESVQSRVAPASRLRDFRFVRTSPTSSSLVLSLCSGLDRGVQPRGDLRNALCGENGTLGQRQGLFALPPLASAFAGCPETSTGIQHVEDLSYSRSLLPTGRRVSPILGQRNNLRPPQVDHMYVVSSWLQSVVGQDAHRMGGRGLR